MARDESQGSPGEVCRTQPVALNGRRRGAFDPIGVGFTRRSRCYHVGKYSTLFSCVLMSEGQVGGPGQAPVLQRNTTVGRSLRCHTRAGSISVSPLSIMYVIYCATNPRTAAGFVWKRSWVIQYVATSGEWQARFDRVTITDRLNVSACHVVLYCTLHFHSHSFPLFLIFISYPSSPGQKPCRWKAGQTTCTLP